MYEVEAIHAVDTEVAGIVVGYGTDSAEAYQAGWLTSETNSLIQTGNGHVGPATSATLSDGNEEAS